ncbi:acyltransferase [Aeromicrobium tamlense]|uniref:Acyltransferase n=1 Tax=Aeromicrobium tamlense TaxID=375541 RepID=A0A8I0FUU3_9ACTN|nr:acyltransferase family protein [Aeromicrobium tamlense]MBD1269381.1 acyltransferase [Aeromicrobium tamlense]NYI36711.1 peptidoglycan/LPS O-acetylase OafA/YrhL [Aeromicrobium tamlense]
MRPEIQALRAAAVLAVVLFHLWPGRLSGGYIGVDVFFVISGFLITSHLMREVERRDRVDLAQFWARRARRLLPAAYLVLFVTAIGVLVWLPPAQWTQNFREIIGSTLYVENWVLAIDSVDYLAADGVPSAVQHYWTLSVEEQFYLVWPLLIVGALALARRRGWARAKAVLVVLSVVTVTCFLFSLWLTSQHPQLAYFATPARAWQFGAGALFAVALVDRIRLPRRTAIAASWLGFGVIAVCALVYDESTPFPGTAAIAPVLATLLVIAAGTPSGRLSPTPIMAWRPVQVTGDLSYSMYLWHWPPIILLPEILGEEMGLWPRVGILLGTFVLAWLTMRFVENPIRFGTRFGIRRPRVTGLVSVFAAALVVGFSVFGYQAGQAEEQRAEEFTARVNADMPKCFGAASMPPAGDCENPELATMRVPAGPDVSRDWGGRSECWGKNDQVELKSCDFGERSGDRPHVVLLGDSHARALLPGFVRLAELDELSLTTQLKGGCAWSTDLPGRTAVPEVLQTCPAWRENVQEWIEQNQDDIDLIVTTGYSRNLAGSRAQQAKALSEAWTKATKLGIPVAAVVDNPDNGTPPAKCLDRVDSWDETTCSVPRDEAFPYGDAFGEAARMTKGAERIDMTDFYCLEDVCPAMIGGVNVYRDRHHFTATFTRTLAPFLWSRITAQVDGLPTSDR